MEMNQRTYGIGIIGCGNISGVHAKAISQTAKGQLISAHTRTEPTLEAFCDHHNIAGYLSCEKFLANPNLDIVVICTPTGTHLDYGILAAQTGKHLIVEKPIEITVDRGQALIKTCRKNNVKLAVIYQNRFIDGVINMKKFLEEGGVGQPIMSRASVKWFRSQGYYDDSSWRGTFALDGGGAVINQSIHTLDLYQWLMGPVKSVTAIKGGLTHEIEVEDNAIACFHFDNGAIGVFEASTSIVPPQDWKIEINGSSGTAFLEGGKFYKMLNGKSGSKSEYEHYEDKSVEADGAASPLAGKSPITHQKQYEQILKAFKQNREPVVSGKESLKSLALVEAIYEAADTEETVSIKKYLDK
jgi:predicted dehydrogenase